MYCVFLSDKSMTTHMQRNEILADVMITSKIVIIMAISMQNLIFFLFSFLVYHIARNIGGNYVCIINSIKHKHTSINNHYGEETN